MSAKSFVIVLDPHRGCLGCAEGVDAEQERQRAMMNGERLGDLEEADELEAVQSLVRDSSRCTLGRRA